jgi:hypothetical protein
MFKDISLNQNNQNYIYDEEQQLIKLQFQNMIEIPFDPKRGFINPFIKHECDLLKKKIF